MAELIEKDLEEVAGGSPTEQTKYVKEEKEGTGTVTMHNMPKINPDEKYVM